MPATSPPIILSPLTPSELLQYLIAHTTYPTTVVIGWPREQFAAALVEDINQQQQQQQQKHHDDSLDDTTLTSHHEQQSKPPHRLLHASLLQTTVSRHIRIVFTPSVAHLRAFLATFSAGASRIPAPPTMSNSTSSGLRTPPLLLVYGLLELHRDGLEWSAQGLNMTTALFIESSMNNESRAVIVEPRRTADEDELEKSLKESIPILNGATLKEDGTWSDRVSVTAIWHVFSSWFEVDSKEAGLA